MSSEAYKRFIGSMQIGYEQWHDGIGYDLAALDELSESERGDVGRILVSRAEKDWRDLEALDRLASSASIEAILKARKSPDPEIRLHAHEVGPAPSQEEWDEAILYSLPKVEPFAGLSITIRCAVAHPSSAVREGLWAQIKDPASKIAYHCAEAIAHIERVTKSIYSDRHRPLFLRLVGPASPDREEAVSEIERLCRKSK